MTRLQSTRNLIGYQYGRLFNNQIGVNTNLTSYTPNLNKEEPELLGEGVLDLIGDVLNKGKNIADTAIGAVKTASDIYSSELGTSLRNMIPDSDNTARKGFAGEKHGILKLPNGKYGVANFLGPGTHLEARLRRGDPSRTEVDKVAKAHDIRYAKARNIGDIRKADRIMNDKVAQIARNRGDAPMNIAQAKLIKAKVGLEDLGLLKRDAFSGDLANKKLSQSKLNLLDSNLKQLEQQGYGMLPADMLKLKLMKTKKKSSQKGKGVYYGSGKGKKLTGVSITKTFPHSKPYQLIGSGLNLPGSGANNITDFVVNKIFPQVAKSVDINPSIIPKSILSKLINKAISVGKGNMPAVVSNLTKAIYTILASQSSQLNKSGSGLKLAGQRGKGIKQKLLKDLGLGVFKALKYHLNKSAKGKGYKPPFKGSGLNPAGSGFWGDFASGFKKVFIPGAKVLGTVATSVGVPEVGVPLGLAGKLLEMTD